ncbi:MAG TPA: glycosyltransferase family 1 protein, partial [Chitinophagaceae bacterium]|nr:glycosyltransferase family 1 protein [Chitinophagaceae bacterium]
MFADAHVFDKEYQGTRTFIKEIYTHLAQKKDLAIYLGAYDIDNLRNIFSGFDNIHFLKYKSRSRFKRLLYDIPSVLGKYKIDYAHFQYISPLVKKCKYIVTIHDLLIYEYPKEFPLSYKILKKILFKRSASRADILTTVSAYSKKSIEKYFRPEGNTIHIIPDGVSKTFFAPYDKSYSQKLIKEKYGIERFILYVSRFEPRKNHISLLKVYLESELYQKGYFLVLLGHKSLNIPEFDSTVAQLPEEIRKFIFISNTIADEELLEFYRASSVFVYPSLAEGFGISPLEAAALKIPVICSNSSAMAEFSFFGEWHINPTNQSLLKKKLLDAISNPPDEEYLTTVSNFIHKYYSWEQSAEKLYHILFNKEIVADVKFKKKLPVRNKYDQVINSMIPLNTKAN